jgi:ribosomal protein L37AE/L43A
VGGINPEFIGAIINGENIIHAALESAYRTMIPVRCPGCGQVIGKEAPESLWIDDCPTCNRVYAGKMGVDAVDFIKFMQPRRGSDETQSERSPVRKIARAAS